MYIEILQYVTNCLPRSIGGVARATFWDGNQNFVKYERVEKLVHMSRRWCRDSFESIGIASRCAES